MNNHFMSHSPLKILRLTVIFLAIGLVGKESNAQQLNEATICGNYADKSIGYKSGRKTSLSCDQISTFMSNSSLRESMFSDFNARFELNPNTTPQQIYQELSGVLQCERKYAPSLPELTCSGSAQGINSVINIWWSSSRTVKRVEILMLDASILFGKHEKSIRQIYGFDSTNGEFTKMMLNILVLQNNLAAKSNERYFLDGAKIKVIMNYK